MSPQRRFFSCFFSVLDAALGSGKQGIVLCLDDVPAGLQSLFFWDGFRIWGWYGGVGG